jgi:2-dehydro-3-deoxyphosphogluconate aldolase/(4S)-4-hydroxy-2-oxoglutarate aldolase
MMNKQATLDAISRLGLLSVLRGPSPDLTLRMVEALVAGGVTGIEVTFTTPQALEVVKSLDERYGDQILLGMGTLTEPEQAAAAQEAGARFLVSPHCQEDLATAMRETGLPIMLGALTPSEVVLSRELGSDVVKLFPGSLGGPRYLKALRGPFPDIPIMPTGGVSKDNVADWFAAGAFAVGAGSNLCPTALAREERFDEISTIAKAFVAAVALARSGS